MYTMEQEIVMDAKYKHYTKTYIPTTWESIGYADGNVLNPAN